MQGDLPHCLLDSVRSADKVYEDGDLGGIQVTISRLQSVILPPSVAEVMTKGSDSLSHTLRTISLRISETQCGRCCDSPVPQFGLSLQGGQEHADKHKARERERVQGNAGV